MVRCAAVLLSLSAACVPALALESNMMEQLIMHRAMISIKLRNYLSVQDDGNNGNPIYTDEYLVPMEAAECTNMDEIIDALGWGDDLTINPYPAYYGGRNESNGYDTTIIKTNADGSDAIDCYIVYPNANQRTNYRLESLTLAQAEAQNDTATAVYGSVFITHADSCGLCSTTKDLHVYLTAPDLATPVTICGILGLVSITEAVKCLQDLGFTEECAGIWFWNTDNSGKPNYSPLSIPSQPDPGGCRGVCTRWLGQPNNQPVRDTSDEHDINYCDPSPPENDPGADQECYNTINGDPACSPDQYEDNEYRINACLQCDECRSGPIFQKYSARTRRGSGITSAINRPPEKVANITHYYTVAAPFPSDVTAAPTSFGGEDTTGAPTPPPTIATTAAPSSADVVSHPAALFVVAPLILLVSALYL